MGICLRLRRHLDMQEWEREEEEEAGEGAEE